MVAVVTRNGTKPLPRNFPLSAAALRKDLARHGDAIQDAGIAIEPGRHQRKGSLVEISRLYDAEEEGDESAFPDAGEELVMVQLVETVHSAMSPNGRAGKLVSPGERIALPSASAESEQQVPLDGDNSDDEIAYGGGY
jgi:hypothetical protein